MQSAPWNSISASPLTVRKHKNDLTDWTGDPARSFIFESDADRLHLPSSIYAVGSDPEGPCRPAVFSFSTDIIVSIVVGCSCPFSYRVFRESIVESERS